MKFFYVALVLVSLLCCSCTEHKRKNIIVFLDNSHSISEVTMAKYINIILEDILPNIGSQDKITLQMIDECSLSRSEKLLCLDLAATDFQKKSDGLNYALDSALARKRHYINDSLKPILKSILLAKRSEREKYGDYTDIINAMNESGSLITGSRNYNSTFDRITNDIVGTDNYTYENCIIILSDMINEDREGHFNFNHLAQVGSHSIHSMITNLEKDDKIPQLPGTKVIIYGATSTDETSINAIKQIENIRLFWKLYLQRAGTDLLAYAYDTRDDIVKYLTDSYE